MNPTAPPESPWVPLPRGCTTGIDWSLPGSTEGRDPYLAWAEADRFRAYQLPTTPCDDASPPEWLPLIIELAPDSVVAELVGVCDPAWLMISAAYLRVKGLRYCTARARSGFFSALQQPGRLAQIVLRYELGLPVDHHTAPLTHSAHPTAPASADAEADRRLCGTVLGLIDGGLAMAHRDFLDERGEPRVTYFWRQDERHGSRWRGVHGAPLDPARAGAVPPQMGYGHELTGHQIGEAMLAHTRNGLVDEDALYQHLQLWDLALHTNHGTHVMSLACAPTAHIDTIASEDRHPDFNQRLDAASTCDLIAVQLDWSNVLDTSGGAMNVSILDGLLYILSRCADEARVVVNISWGTLAGPHDGTSILEAAMDQLIELRDGRLDIVVPAGNGYQSRTHANATLGGAGSEETTDTVTLNWRVQPDDQTQSFLELWLCDPALPDEPIRDLSITVQPPGHAQPLPPISVGQSGVWPSAQAPRCALLFPQRSALGRQGTCALLALAPTFSHQPEAITAPCGVWQVTIKNHGLNPVVLDAYIERDDVAMGTQTGARQSYFEDVAYDNSGGLNSFIDDPDNPTPIRRSGSFNSLSTGRRTVSVGGVRHALSAFDPFARYSPRMPDPDGTRPQRPGVKTEPDRWAVTDDNAALWGIRGAGGRSGSERVRLAGTSGAAPQITRTLINAAPNSGSTSGSEAV